MHVSGLFIYPVKSLGGCSLSVAQLDALGISGDRRFLVVDDTGRFLTQRTLPRMALIKTALTSTHLTLAAPDRAPLQVPLRAEDHAAPPRLLTVSIWKNEGLLAEDCGEAAAVLLSEFLDTRCRLARIGAAFRRPVAKPGKARPDDFVHFADAYPLLVISEASLTDLNDRLVEEDHPPVPMNRFRPNLVVSGCEAFAEDTWGRFQIGTAVFRAGGPCSRCIVITTDQLTAERGKEPLRLLSKYRRDPTEPGNVNFGQNLFHESKTGTLRLGDRVELLV